MKNLFNSPAGAAVISVFATLLMTAGYFKLAGPVPISVSQTTLEKQAAFDVPGEGTATAIPDVAEISLGITASGGNIKEVQDRANKITNEVSAAVKKLGVKPEDIKTANYSINPVYNYLGDNRTIKEYQISATLRVTARDLPTVNQVIDAAVSLGANRINGLVFTFDEAVRRRLESEARKQAVADAQEKAREMAADSGMRLGKIVNVQFEEPRRPVSYGLREAAISADIGTNVEPGSAEIKVSVILSYEIL